MSNIQPIASEDEFQTIFNLTQFEIQYPQFRYETTKNLLQDVMLAEIHARMKSLGYSQKIIDSTRIQIDSVDTNGDIDYTITSDYESDTSFDVSKAREEGTKDHFIKPNLKSALSWLGGYIRLFSKGHWVKGITRSNVIRKTRKEYEPIIQKLLDDATDQFYLSIVGDK